MSPQAEPRSGAVVRTVPARVGLVGNPSDGFGGAVLAVPVPVGSATVRVEAVGGVQIDRAVDDPLHDGSRVSRWPSLETFRGGVATEGHVGHDRIITASLAVLLDHLDVSSAPMLAGIRVAWGSDIPRSVGLAGSSALAVATIDAAARSWGHTLPTDVVAALALSAEVDRLGIAAGWQDRIVQSRAVPVLVETAELVDVGGVAVPTVRVLRAGSPFILVVGWRRSSSESSDGYHRRLRAVDGPARDAAMLELADLARSAAHSFEVGDVGGLGRAMDAGWQVRQRVAPLRPDHAELIESIHAVGVPATTPGSGGSVVALTANRTIAGTVVERLRDHGAEGVIVSVGPDGLGD